VLAGSVGKSIVNGSSKEYKTALAKSLPTTKTTSKKWEHSKESR